MGEVQFVDVTKKETKESHELADAAESLVCDILDKAADGLTVDEIVSALAGNVQKVIKGADNAKQMGEEAKQAPGEFTRSWTNMGTGVLSAAVKYSRAREAYKEAHPEPSEASSEEAAEEEPAKK